MSTNQLTDKTSAAKSCRKNNDKEQLLSQEDLDLKQRLELYVQWVKSSDPTLQKDGLSRLREEMQSSECSITLVPKPLKFLQPHYETLKAYFETRDSDSKMYLADILSYLALNVSGNGNQESVEYLFLSRMEDIASWGDIYVRNLAGELQEACYYGKLSNIHDDDIEMIVRQIVAFYLQHNAEHEAVDFVIEFHIEDLSQIEQLVDATNYKKTCLYLTSLVRYIDRQDIDIVLVKVSRIYFKLGEFSSALRVALFLDDLKVLEDILTSCDLPEKKQLCCILALHGVNSGRLRRLVELQEMQDIINNVSIRKWYLTLARDIGVLEPISPEDVCKVNLFELEANGEAGEVSAAIYVNAFVNAAFGQDYLFNAPSKSSSDSREEMARLCPPGGHEKASSVASLGMILLWDLDRGLSQMVQYINGNDILLVAGAFLGLGVAHCGVRRNFDPALEYFTKFIHQKYQIVQRYAIMGLGIGYAGTRDNKLFGILYPFLRQGGVPLVVIVFTAISLGLIYVGSCNEMVSDAIVSAIKNRSELEFEYPITRLLILGLGLVYLGKKEAVEYIDIKIFSKKIRKLCEVTLESCAYAGTGDISKVKNLLRHCEEHLKGGVDHQGPAVLGLAIVAMGEEVGQEMVLRSLEHLLQYGEQNIRQAVPLAIALLWISNPQVKIADTLSKLSHDKFSSVFAGAIISLGLIGAGTNNHRIAGLLQRLSRLHRKNNHIVFLVHVAQGLLHLGKGLLTLAPYHSDGLLYSRTAVAGLLVFLYACLNMDFILRHHYVLYYLVLAMKPRMLMTVNENMEILCVPVRVGKAVDVVCQAGQPRTISDFRTLSTPILLEVGERAELATEKYIPVSPILEGIVILKEKQLCQSKHGPTDYLEKRDKEKGKELECYTGIGKIFQSSIKSGACFLSKDYLKSQNEIAELVEDDKWTWFKDCIGALDGTHVPVIVPLEDQETYRNRKQDITTNVLGVCGRNMKFIYVLHGWEGSTSDSRVLRNALTRFDPLVVPTGKYYAGYTNGVGFLAPYRGVVTILRNGHQVTIVQAIIKNYLIFVTHLQEM